MKRFFALLLMAISIPTMTGCLPIGDKDCDQPFEQIVEPSRIQGSSHVFVKLEQLDFLFEKNVILDDVEMQATIEGRKKRTDDITLSLNGIKVSRRDGKLLADAMEDLQSLNSLGRYKLHKMFLNGGTPFDRFMAQLKKNKGELKLSFQGRNVKIVSARFVFKGRKRTCTDPDPDPNPDPKPAAVSKIDSVSPSAAVTNSTSIAIAFSANQTGVTFWCSLDGAAFAKCTSPANYSGLASGEHVFKVYSQNSSGVNETPGVEYRWTVDTIAPNVSIANLAQLKSLTNASVIEFVLASNEASTFQCSIDGSAYEACVSPKQYSGLSEGNHIFAARAVDALGNISGEPAIFQWTVDLTAPQVQIVKVDPFASISNISTRVIEFTASESANFECSLDNGAFSACTSPVALSNLAEGNHWFEVRARDLAGNESLAISAAWKNDYTKPQILLGNVSPAAGLTRQSLVSVEFSANEPAQTFCAVDGNEPVECSSPFSPDEFGDGPHQVRIHALDFAGNKGDETVISWTIDTQAPVLSFISILPSANLNVNVRDLTFQVDAPADSQIIAKLNGASIPATATIQLTDLVDGSYVLSVQAVDAAGNTSNEITHTFVVDTLAPELSITPDEQTLITRLDRRTFFFSSNEEVTYECNLDSAGFAPCSAQQEFAGLADGDHLLAVRATDFAGNQTERSYSWSVDTISPIASGLSLSVTQTSISITWTTSEPATRQVRYGVGFSITSQTAETEVLETSHNVVLTGLSPNTVYAVQVFGRDQAGNVYLSSTRTVRTAR